MPKADFLRDKIPGLGIRESDLEERFIRSRGPGGQNVNKTSTCVYLRHRPTGMEVKCQKERSQALNRLLARLWLAKKLERLKTSQEAAERSQQEKVKRQGRLRSRKAKERILKEKRLISEKKKLRANLHNLPTEE